MSTLGIFNFYGTAGLQCVFVYGRQSIVPPTKPPDSVPVPRSDVKLYQLTRRRGFLKRRPWLFYKPWHRLQAMSPESTRIKKFRCFVDVCFANLFHNSIMFTKMEEIRHLDNVALGLPLVCISWSKLCTASTYCNTHLLKHSQYVETQYCPQQRLNGMAGCCSHHQCEGSIGCSDGFNC